MKNQSSITNEENKTTKSENYPENRVRNNSIEIIVITVCHMSYVQPVKGTYGKPVTCIVLNGERLNVFHLRSKTRQGCLLKSQ